MQHVMSVPFGAPPATARKNKAVSVIIVGAVHVVLIYGLLGIAGVVPVPKPPDCLCFIDPTPPTKPPPPLPQPRVDVPGHISGPTAVEPQFTIDDGIKGGINVPLVPPNHSTTLLTIGAQLLTRAIPPYPMLDVRLGHEGIVSLKLSIDASGTVTDAVVTRSSGFDTLNSAAVAWVKAKWRYRPAQQNGEAVATTALAAVKFELRNR